jgi:hypothetical protein
VTATPTSTATPPSSPVLLGSQDVEELLDSNAPGLAEAFQYTADGSGTVTELVVYLDASSTASKVVVGLYADNGSDSPGALLAQATIAAPAAGSWNSAAVAGVNVVAGNRYWLAILQPTSSTGTIRFRDTDSGGPAQTSLQTNLATLPSTWQTGSTFVNSPLSAYASR